MFDPIDSLRRFHGFDDEPRFGRGFGHMFGPGGFGPRRFLERGAIKILILDLIRQKPRHGYDIIQELENTFHGFYNPSAGTVYPILQLLQDQDFVTSDEKNGKKVYAITDSGKKFLEENAHVLEQMEKVGEKFSKHFGGKTHDLRVEIHDTMKVLFKNAAHGGLKDPETVKEVREALSDFREKIEKIFAKRKVEDDEEE